MRLLALAALLLPLGLQAQEADAKRRVEAPLPAGFVEPGPLDQVVLRELPAHRAVEGPGFRDCFRHIERRGIPMTAPVVMTMTQDDGGEIAGMAHMRFLYPSATAGAPEADGSVRVVDVPASRVLTIAVKGGLDDERRAALVARLEADAAAASPPLAITGPVQVLGYNSPFNWPWNKLWEVQLPVRSADEG